MLHPANKNPTEIIRIDKIQSLAVSSDKSNKLTKGTAKI